MKKKYLIEGYANLNDTEQGYEFGLTNPLPERFEYDPKFKPMKKAIADLQKAMGSVMKSSSFGTGKLEIKVILREPEKN
jgi:hypothetical protein